MPPTDLSPGSSMTDAGLMQPVLFDRETGEYRFNLVYYTQSRDGFPVFRADLRLLTRNHPGHPLVLAKSALRDLGAFRVPADWAKAALSIAQAQDIITGRYPDLVNFGGHRLVIWAGYDDQMAEPRLAYEILADNQGVGAPVPTSQLFLVDAFTGALLFSESQIFHTDVQGSVRANVTSNSVADACAPETSQPMPYARITSGGATIYADAQGNFAFPTDGKAPLTLNSLMSGRYFVVADEGGPLDDLALLVTPPGPADFLHNAANTNAYIRAQANTYYYANLVRDFTLRFNPDYPTIASQFDMQINVNIEDDCNAFYSSAAQSINFFRALGGCFNTGFGTVVHHEYGHHLVWSAGSGQGPYGEGSGDVMAILLTDSPLLGIGFFGNCGGALRDADNNCQYLPTGCSTCGSTVHACGRLLSGSVWDVRTNLLATNPSNYRDIVANLAVNAMLLHQGTVIDSSIAIDYLTLDDDDETILNGSPHYVPINAGFTAHSMGGPAVPALRFVFPEGRPETLSTRGGTTVSVVVEPLTGQPMHDTGVLHFSTGGPFTAVPMTQTAPHQYIATFPAFECGAEVSYYFSAQSLTSITATSPHDAPASTFTAVGASGLQVAFSDSMETNAGWTAGITGDTATSGRWTRVDPIGTVAQPEDDTTPAPGVNCFVTGQGTPNGGSGEADVDNGVTTLLSPAFDLTNLHSPRVAYKRWYSNNAGAAPNSDVFVVQISNNNGVSWAAAETVGPSGVETGGGWFHRELRVADILTPTSQMRVRFIASDLGSGSLVEAAVDDFVAYGFVCESPCPADFNNDGAANSQDYFDFLTAFFAGNADFNDDGTTNSQDYFDFLVVFFEPCP